MITPLWEVAILAVGAGVGLLIEYRRNHWRLKAWQNAASSCGLKVVETSGAKGWSVRLHGRAGPVEVWIEEVGGKRETRVIVAAPGPPGFADVRVRREQPEPAAREIEIGDEEFDSTFSLEGPARLVCALLDAETRRLLISANAGSEVDITNGRIQASRVLLNVSVVLPPLLAVGQRIARLMEAPRLLAENVRADPEPGVRLRSLLLLIRELPGDPSTLEALRAACMDPNPRVRLRAAQELGSDRSRILAELAENTEDDATSAQAISLLGQELPVESTRAILIHALRRRRLRTARACLESLGCSGAAGVDTLAKVMAREKSDLSVAAAQALGATASPSAEPPLILALQRERADLRVAAAKALGRVGTAAAVLPLKEAAERSSRDPELRRATRQAIAEIQSRVQGASPGQLSLAGADTGQLSLAQAETGQLSLANDPAGQLSLGDDGVN